MSKSKYILGTANLGQKYGINNKSEYNFQYSEDIFLHALSNDLKWIDTSPDYGLAHKLIAKNISGKNNLKITTKISAKVKLSPDEVLTSFKNSLTEMQIDHLDTVLFHNPDSYLSVQFGEIVKILLDTGKVNHVGVSVYNKTQILQSLENSNLLTKFQVPENILDRRLISDSEMNLLHAQGIIFEVRSIFLQGLLLAHPLVIKDKVASIYQQLFELNQFASDISTSIVDICLNYAEKIDWNEGTIISAASIPQLEEILSHKEIDFDFSTLPTLPEEFLDPRNWDFKL